MKNIDNELTERLAFLKVYNEFDNWLNKLGFKIGNYTKSYPEDNHYSHYNEKIDDLYSVERYDHPVLGYSIRFMRDRNKHQFMFIGSMGSSSKVMPMNEFKELIKQDVIEIRDAMLNDLNSIIVD